MGEVAVRWLELGQSDKAKALFAEALRMANAFADKTDFQRGMFAAKLARVDLPAAEAIARDFKGASNEGRILGNMAFYLADTSPADAERLWRQSAEKMGGLRMMDLVLCWKLAGVDPARALRVVDALPNISLTPEKYFYVAVGARARDESLARQSFQTALQGLDRMMEERPLQATGAVLWLLPVVEGIDPGLVPEILWRLVASRLPYGNPRALDVGFPILLIEELAAYDRQVAAALLEPALARMEQTDPKELATWMFEFLAWSVIDPRAAVARLEIVPIAQDTDVLKRKNGARFAVGAALARSRERRWSTRRDERQVILGGKRSFLTLDL